MASPEFAAMVTQIRTAMPDLEVVVEECVAEGDKVVKGDLILVLEAMKMEQPLVAHKDGVVASVNATVGLTVSSGHLLMNIAD